MSNTTIQQRINEIFRDVFDNEDLVITREHTAADIEEWDSLTHVQLIFSIEKAFKIKFTTTEIQQFKQVGDLMDRVEQKIAG